MTRKRRPRPDDDNGRPDNQTLAPEARREIMRDRLFSPAEGVRVLYTPPEYEGDPMTPQTGETLADFHDRLVRQGLAAPLPSDNEGES